MKLAIMQPYLFPYIGYFQLIRSVDAFVVFDDVNYIRGGWINRNFMLGNGGKQLFTLPLVAASQNKRINEIEVGGQHKILQSLRQGYGKAPYFDAVYPILEDILTHQEKNLARFLDYQLRQLCAYLGLEAKWYISSELEKDRELRGQDKIIAICEELGATHYINPPGGQDLYDKGVFAERGLQLSFIQPRGAPYRQFGEEFLPYLSIVDVLMFNDKVQCAALLDEYELA